MLNNMVNKSNKKYIKQRNNIEKLMRIKHKNFFKKYRTV